MKVFYSDISDFKFDVLYFKKKVVNDFIKNDILIDDEKLILVDEKMGGIIGHLLKLFRLFFLHRNEQETFIYPSEEKIILELIYDKCINHVMKDQNELDKNIIEDLFDFIIKKKLNLKIISNNADLDANINNFEEIYKLYEEYLLKSNIVDSADLVLRLKNEYEHNEEFKKCLNSLDYIVTFKKLGIVETSWYMWLLKEASFYQIKITMPRNNTFANDILPDTASLMIENKRFDDFNSFNTSEIIFRSPSELHFLKLIISYMSLLVNSRNELCLANVINVPDRGLNETAFTLIKHVAACKKMSMYQIMVSYVTRIKLGGKGYAAEKDCPLKDYVKGLSDFIEVMNKLHTFIEENDHSLQATTQIISYLKKILINYALTINIGRTKIDDVMNCLMKDVTKANEEMIMSELETPTRSVGSGASLRGRKTLRLIRNLLDNYALIMYYDCDQNIISSSQKTPVRIPSLASKFRSPILEVQDALKEHLPKNKIKNDGVDNSEQLYFDNISSTIINTNHLKRKSDEFDFELKKPKKASASNSDSKLSDVTNISIKKIVSDKTIFKNDKKSVRESVDSQNNIKKSKAKLLPISKKQVLLKGQTKLSLFFSSN